MNPSAIKGMQITVLTVLCLAGLLFIYTTLVMTSSMRFGMMEMFFKSYALFLLFMLSSLSIVFHGALMKKFPSLMLPTAGTIVTTLASLLSGFLIISLGGRSGEGALKLLTFLNSLSISLGLISLYMYMPDKGSMVTIKKIGIGVVGALFVFVNALVFLGASGGYETIKTITHFLQILAVVNGVLVIIALYISYGMPDATQNVLSPDKGSDVL